VLQFRHGVLSDIQALDIADALPQTDFTMTKTLKDEIIEQVDHLDPPKQRKVLDFARHLASPAGTPGRNLLRYAGSIEPADLESMAQAIQEGCEKIKPNAW